MNSDFTVTLENCADEPIHSPGSIQPHGSLIVFGQHENAIGWSANIGEILNAENISNLKIADLPLATEAVNLIQECISQCSTGEVAPMAVETTIKDELFDVVVHCHNHYVIAEFERRSKQDAVSGFALKAHNAINRLKKSQSIQPLLQTIVEQVSALTGFDRVMAYRFRHDDSGEVVAEVCRDDLEPYLDRRYPASDIPDQARRLYIANTLRLIADINYQAVPILMNTNVQPLDMSHCVLRSVSPIHIEYLQNMGVAASMSVSIVINGKLWGLVACHHMQPRQVPYSVRMACDVLAQILASSIQTIENQNFAALTEQAAIIRTRLIETLRQEDDVLLALSKHANSLQTSLNADGLILTECGKVLHYGALSKELVNALVHSLPENPADLMVRIQKSEWPESLQQVLGRWVGMLGLCFDPSTKGWIIALRLEQIENVKWAGRPEKNITIGPRGPRLTPRGSFEEWRQTVRETAEPWNANTLNIARQLLAEMHRASIVRHSETEKARTQLMAMLGHDLRDPLQSISMAGHIIEMGAYEKKLGQRITSSSGRMQRLITQVMDVSRIRGGLGLDLNFNDIDVVKIVEDLLDEVRLGYPGTQYRVDMPASLIATVDADRLAQVISNLISNARHHGETGESIYFELAADKDQIKMQIKNVGLPIDEKLVPHLFDPFKRSSTNKNQNRTGIGLGLYITNAIVSSHKGEINYRYDAPHVIFTVTLPFQTKIT